LIVLLLILTPSMTSREEANLAIQRHSFNMTESEPLSIILTMSATVSAGYAIYNTFKDASKEKERKNQLGEAKAMAALFDDTHRDLCTAVHGFLQSLLQAGQKFVESSASVSCTGIGNLEILKGSLAEADEKPFGNAEQINAVIQDMCSESFTERAAIKLHLEIERWNGVQQGLGCSTSSLDTSFLEQAWKKHGAARIQPTSNSLQQSQFRFITPMDWIAIGLFLVVLHTDIYSAIGAFSSANSAADVYQSFTTNQVESLQRLSCRLSYPMYLRSLRVKALETALLAVDFNSANLKLPPVHDLDVGSDCEGYDMVCLSQTRCLRAIADMSPNRACGRETISRELAYRKSCLFSSKLDEISNSHEGTDCKLRNGKFYQVCGPDSTLPVVSITTIVPTTCFQWETWYPGGALTRANSGKARPVATYHASRECSQRFQSLKDVGELVSNFKKKKIPCKW